MAAEGDIRVLYTTTSTGLQRGRGAMAAEGKPRMQ